MYFEPWMFVAMEDEGIMDTRTGRINKVAKFLARQNLNYIGNDAMPAVLIPIISIRKISRRSDRRSALCVKGVSL